MRSSFLVPCPECARHVRTSDARCPFCSSPLELAEAPAPRLPERRLSRAATFAFGATLLGAATVAACGGAADDDDDDGKGKGGTSTGAKAGGGGAAGNAAGASGGTTFGGAPGTSSGAPGNAGVAGVAIAPPYGVPPQR